MRSFFFFVILNKIRHWNLRGTFTFKWGFFFFFCLYIRKKGDFWIKCLLPKRSGNPFSAENSRKVSVGNHTLKLGWKSLINSKPRFGYIRKSWNETFFFFPHKDTGFLSFYFLAMDNFLWRNANKTKFDYCKMLQRMEIIWRLWLAGFNHVKVKFN